MEVNAIGDKNSVQLPVRHFATIVGRYTCNRKMRTSSIPSDILPSVSVSGSNTKNPGSASISPGTAVAGGGGTTTGASLTPATATWMLKEAV